MRGCLDLLFSRVDENERRLQTLEQTALKTGSPITAFKQRLKDLADAVEPTDAVTLRQMKQWVNTIVAVFGKAETTPTGTGPTTPVPPAPGATFTASPIALPAGGGSVLLTWSTTNATSVRLGQVSGATETLTPASGGSTTKVITTSTVFTLFVTGPGGSIQRTATITVSGTELPPPPPGAGRLRAAGTGFTLDGQPIDFLGCTLFTSFFDQFWAPQFVIDEALDQLVKLQQANVRMPRVLVTVARHVGWTDGFLTGYSVWLDPANRPNFYQNLDAYCRLAASHGLFPEYVVFGDCTDGFATQAERDTVCREVATILRHYPCFVQISNEPAGTNIGREGDNYSAYDPYAEAQRLAYVYRSVDGNNPLSTWATPSLPSNSTLLLGPIQPPADWAAFHSSRDPANDKWQWVIDHITNLAVRRNGSPMPVVDDEPMNSSGNRNADENDDNPVHWWAWGCLCQLLKIGATFHSHPLLASQVNDPADQANFAAWIQGRRTVSSQMAATNEFYATSAGALVGDCPWTATTALALYGRHNGVSGMALIMRIDGGFSVTANLAAGWSVAIVEQRQDAILVSVLRS